MTHNFFRKNGITAAYWLFAISTAFVLLFMLYSAKKDLPALDSYSAIEQMHLPLEQFFYAVASSEEKDRQEIETKFDIFYSRFVLHTHESPLNRDFNKNEKYRSAMTELSQEVDFFQRKIATLKEVSASEKTKITERISGMRSVMSTLSNIVYEVQIKQYRETLQFLFLNRLVLGIYMATAIFSGLLLRAGMRFKPSSHDAELKMMY